MNRGLYFSQPSFDQSEGSVLGYWLYPAISRVRWIPEFSLCWDYKLLFFKAGTQSPCVALQWDINSACLSASSFYTHQVCPHRWNIAFPWCKIVSYVIYTCVKRACMIFLMRLLLNFKKKNSTADFLRRKKIVPKRLCIKRSCNFC